MIAEAWNWRGTDFNVREANVAKDFTSGRLRVDAVLVEGHLEGTGVEGLLMIPSLGEMRCKLASHVGQRARWDEVEVDGT